MDKDKIEALRERMHDAYEREDSLTAPELLDLAAQVDELVVIEMKKMSTSTPIA